jgi:hypothetical protein
MAIIPKKIYSNMAIIQYEVPTFDHPSTFILLHTGKYIICCKIFYPRKKRTDNRIGRLSNMFLQRPALMHTRRFFTHKYIYTDNLIDWPHMTLIHVVSTLCMYVCMHIVDMDPHMTH